MRNRNLKAWWLCALCALVLCATACSDDADDDNDNTTDTGTTDTGNEDTGTDDTVYNDMGTEDTGDNYMATEDTGDNDMGTEDTGTEDVTPGEGACTNESDVAILEAEGYSEAMGGAVAYVAQGCLLGDSELELAGGCPTTPDNCNCREDQIDDCGIDECVANTIEDYEDGDVADADVNTAILVVQATPVSQECMGCSAGIPACIAANMTECVIGAGCAGEPDTCECRTCQCEQGCVDQYVACSGRDPYIDGCPSPTPEVDGCTED